jgi:hypothetical protein
MPSDVDILPWPLLQRRVWSKVCPWRVAVLPYDGRAEELANLLWGRA